MQVLEPIAEQLRAFRTQKQSGSAGGDGGQEPPGDTEMEALTGRHQELSLKLYGTRLLLGRLVDADQILQRGILYCIGIYKCTNVLLLLYVLYIKQDKTFTFTVIHYEIQYM